MANFFQTLETVLKKDKRFFSKDTETLLRNKVYESAVNMDTALIKLLLSNNETKSRFFTDVDGVLVFDKIAFGWVVNNHQFLPDSYTRFKNRIGLSDSNGELISASNDVVLSFPYKDCILEGGQTKEDQKRDEVFYNSTLAPDDVDRLLYPKVLVGAKRYTANGVEEDITFNNDDNLIIKGNNLLSLACLQKKYSKKIKLIYADPPYNTKGATDTFSYNNSFNHSTWLTFMKNRLSIAKELLREDGFIAVTIDHCELFYLGLLMDELFGTENRVGIVTILINPKGRQHERFFSAATEYMLVYAKNSAIGNFEKVVLDEKKAKTFDQKDKNGKFKWLSFTRIRTSTLREKKPNFFYPIYVNQDLTIVTHEKKNGYTAIYPISNGKEYSWKTKLDTFIKYNIDDYFRVVKIDNQLQIQHKYREQQVHKNLWIDKKYFPEFQGTNLLKKLIGNIKVSYPKSLYAVIDTIKLLSANNDIVLDFFGGSGTTAHAVIEANKKQDYNRRFIICEQLDEHINVIQKRLEAVLKQADLLMNSSYIYCELSKCNQYFVDKAKAAKNDKEAIALLDQVLATGFISHKVFPVDISEAADEFADLSLADKKRFILELLDKNMLYVNLYDMNDKDYAISKADKAFTNSFYKAEGK